MVIQCMHLAQRFPSPLLDIEERWGGQVFARLLPPWLIPEPLQVNEVLQPDERGNSRGGDVQHICYHRVDGDRRPSISLGQPLRFEKEHDRYR
jgi:hypothetical protein